MRLFHRRGVLSSSGPVFRVILDDGSFFPYERRWVVYVDVLRAGSSVAPWVPLQDFQTMQQAIDWAKQRAQVSGAKVTWKNSDGSEPVVDYSAPRGENVRG
jgi:hypothetical protein